MGVGGMRLVDTILSNIDRADVFACDLTYPNPNVSFELGYAIVLFYEGLGFRYVPALIMQS